MLFTTAVVDTKAGGLLQKGPGVDRQNGAGLFFDGILGDLESVSYGFYRGPERPNPSLSPNINSLNILDSTEGSFSSLRQKSDRWSFPFLALVNVRSSLAGCAPRTQRGIP